MPLRLDRAKVQLRIAGCLLLAVLAGFGWLTVALYEQDFTATDLVTVRADRAGLQMHKGTVVKLRGVDVGRIAGVRPLSDGTAEISLAMKPGMINQIPDNVRVSLAQLSAFGNKAVLLQMPARPSSAHLAAGDVIATDHVSVEVNRVFDDLEHVLRAVRPAEVDGALSALAGALDGHGNSLGSTLVAANDYVAQLNRDLPTLRTDLRKGAAVLDTYAAIMPNLITTLSNTSVISRTISSHGQQVRATLDSVTALGADGSRFMALQGDQLAALLARATTTTELLAEYSPEFACLLKTQDWYQRHAQRAFGGQYAAVHVVLPLEQGTGAYRSPSNLPNITAHDGPHCYGMPSYRGGPLPRAVTHWKDPSGPAPWPSSPSINNQPLALQLFGPLATLGGRP